MKHFRIEEFEASPTAESMGIDNTMPTEARRAVERLVEVVLDPLREEFAMPIYVNSGYRSAALNAAVGGVANSQHRRGEAADITSGTREGNMRLWRLLRKMRLPVDQAINEHNYPWIHVSHKAQHNRGEFIG